MAVILPSEYNNMLQKAEQSLKTTNKCNHSFSWRVLMLGCFFFILLHATVAMTLEATTMGISTATAAAMMATVTGTVVWKSTNDVLRRSMKVGFDSNATILCKTSKRSNTFFYDVANKQFIQPLNIEHDLLNPYAVLILYRIRQASTYQCWQNETLLSETFLKIDSFTQTVRIEIGIGDDAALTCRHDENQQIYFQKQTRRNIDSIGGRDDIFTDIVPIDSKTSILLISNASEQISTISCTYLNNKHIDESELNVGTPPLPVNNFNCWGNNYHSMICEFFIPPNNILPEYNLTYLVDFQRDLKYCELEYTREKGILVLNTSTYGSKCHYYPTGDIYKFYLVEKNVLGSSQEYFPVHNHEHVIPPKLEIALKDITSNSVNLVWTDYQNYYYRLDIIYDIHIKPVDLNGYSTTSPCNGLQCNMTLANLTYANWNYTLTISARVNATKSRWNVPSIVSLLTEPRIPDRAPKTVVGSFYIHYNSANKEITLYWEELAKYEENGPEFHYNIQEFDMNGKVCNSKRTKDTAAVFSWSDEPKIYEVRAVNALGESHAVSKIRADKPKTVYAPQEIEQLYSNGTYILTWKHPGDYHQQPPTNYTVFWCQARTVSPKECEGTMRFKVIDNSKTEFIIDSDNRTLTMAVAANYPNWSTGLHWKTCFGALGGELEKVMPEAVSISATNISLKWRLEETCIKALKGYNITYCEVQTVDQFHCDSQYTTSTINNPGIQKYNLTNLKPYSLYRITMILFSETKWGPPSDYIYCRTKDAAPDPPTNLRFDNTSLTSNSLNISWDAPLVTNGILQKYTIWRRIKNYTTKVDVPIRDLTHREHNRISFKLEGLSSYSMYEVWVTAWTSEESKKNENRNETLHIKTLIGRPSTPRDVRLTKEGNYYILNWTDPEMPSGRVELYELTFFEGNKTKVAFVQRGTKSTHQCRLRYPGCTEAVQKMEVRAVNVVPEKELDKNTFPIKGGTVQRRRRYTNPAITTGPVHIQTTTSLDKNSLQKDENVIEKFDRTDTVTHEYRVNQDFKCLDEDTTTKLQIETDIKYYMLKSSPGFSDSSFNCETFPWEILVASLLFVGMFLATVSWSYNFIHRQLGVRVKFPDPINDLMSISTKLPDNLTDNKHENDLSDTSNTFDYFSKSKEEAYLLKYGSALTPNSSESGVHDVDGADNVSRNSSRNDGEEYFTQRVTHEEIVSTQSTTTLNDTSLSSDQHSPLQHKIEQNKPIIRNDGYLAIEQITGTKSNAINVEGSSSSESSYMALHDIATKSGLNSVPVKTGDTIDDNTNTTSVNSIPITQSTTETSPSKPTIFSNYLPNNFLPIKTTPAQPNIFTNLSLTTGNYVLPDALPKLAAPHQAVAVNEENEQTQKPLQQPTNPIVSYGYVTSDFWSQPNTMK